MTRIYQALERANLEQLKPERKVAAALPQKQTAPLGLSSRVEGLYHTLCAMLPDSRGRVIQFLGTHAGVGVTTMVSELAHVAGNTHHRSVLIVDANYERGSYCGRFGLAPTVGLQEVLSNNQPVGDAIVQVGTSHLYYTAFSSSGGDGLVTDEASLTQTFEDLRDEFDFILIDAAPTLESPVGLALGKLADGVLILIEAEKTRWQVAESTRAALEKHGANVLGVVLNKRRYHIPEFIYRLF